LLGSSVWSGLFTRGTDVGGLDAVEDGPGSDRDEPTDEAVHHAGTPATKASGRLELHRLTNA